MLHATQKAATLCCMAKNRSKSDKGSAGNIELQEFAEQLGKLLRGAPDLQSLHAACRAVDAVVDWFELEGITRALADGESWGGVGVSLGMSRQGAQARADRLAIRILEAGIDLPVEAEFLLEDGS